MPIWIILICAAILLQTTVFSSLNWLKLWGVKPDLILIIVVYAAFWKGSMRGAMVGFAGGIIEDILSGGLLGANALAKVVTGYVFGLSRKKFYTQSARVQIVAAFLATLLSQLAFFFLTRMCGVGKTLNSLGSILLPAAVYNAILAPFVFLLLRKIVKQRYDKTRPD